MHLSSTYSEKNYNQRSGNDHVVLEHFFGMLTTLWAILSNRIKWSEELYDFVYKFYASLTNQHIVLHHLKGNDGPRYLLYWKQLYGYGVLSVIEKAEKQKATAGFER